MTGRIPYFTFSDVESGEDAERSAELGYPVPKMVTFIHILPHGHKDTLDFNAEEFIARKSREAASGVYDRNWVDEFKAGLSNYKNGKEVTRSGTPTLLWERLLKSRREILARTFPTVEDIAEVPDSSLNTIGLDGRPIRDLARGDIQAKKNLSPVVKELSDANETIRRQQEQLDKLSKRLENLESKKKTKDLD